jgi:hypothetical protein
VFQFSSVSNQYYRNLEAFSGRRFFWETERVDLVTMTEADDFLKASLRLHEYLVHRHWNGHALVGPDPIGKINWRVMRFVKSYTRWIPWSGNFIYLQGQGYWTRDNVILFELTGDHHYLELVEKSTQYIVRTQTSEGVWEHPPLRERRGFVSALETMWACLGLVTAYEKLENPIFLSTLIKGYEGLVNSIGYTGFKDKVSLNYYAHSKSMVPNINTIFLWLAAEIFRITGEQKYLEHVDPILLFLESSQLESGELQYCYGIRPHFQCYQYNSFQFLTLAEFYILTENETARRILARLAQFLSGGITTRGSCRYDCYRENPETNYWTAALGAAFYQAQVLGLAQQKDLSDKAYRRLLSRQKPDGSFDFSDNNYRVLVDRTSYPRQQVMIMDCLLLRVKRVSRNANGIKHITMLK